MGARALATLPLILPAAGRPLRVAVEALLSGRGLGPARVAAEASGWEAMLALARLNVGVALINDIVPCPPGLESRSVRGLPAVVYRGVTRRRRGAVADALMAALLRVPGDAEETA
jgi:DNA-binding transcriptional LysR family regulator